MFRAQIGPAGFSSSDVERAAEILAGGGVGIIPTDTVYGLTALASHEGAVKRLLDIKDRPAGKPPPVQISEAADAHMLTFAEKPDAVALMKKFWPGPLTIVLRRREGVDLPFQERESLALRMPDNSFCLELIRAAGFLVVPSANRSGEPPPVSVEEVAHEVVGLVDFVVDGGACKSGAESTVVDLTGGLQVLREGAITREEIERALGESEGSG
ncbi:MAG: threonylcarbamoyl-AMP synthase [Actinobacteria bacterium]|nr:threonylcarbamoyl-AMP synthase [Actinomycetota bacterium]